MSNVSIKLLREGAKLPTRGSAFAAGYDLYACLDGDGELRSIDEIHHEIWQAVRPLL